MDLNVLFRVNFQTSVMKTRGILSLSDEQLQTSQDNYWNYLTPKLKIWGLNSSNNYVENLRIMEIPTVPTVRNS